MYLNVCLLEENFDLFYLLITTISNILSNSIGRASKNPVALIASRRVNPCPNFRLRFASRHAVKPV